MVVMSEMEGWQHQPWGATSDCAELRMAKLVRIRELGQWRSILIGRVGIDWLSDHLFSSLGAYQGMG